MSDAARVRISKVTSKAGGASITILAPPPEPDDTDFIPTLLWLIQEARAGKLVGYALVASIVSENGNSQRCIEAAKAWSDGEEHHALGLMTRMQQSYMKRTWPDDG
jgi:hypothetical protein